MSDLVMFGLLTREAFVLWLVLSVLALVQFGLLLYAIHVALKEKNRLLTIIEKMKQSQDQPEGFRSRKG